jgi:hypothetical protein
MSTQITIEVPDSVASQAQRFQARLAEALERGLRELSAEESAELDESAIIDVLSSQPTPERILAIRPSPEFQARVSDLLYQSKHGELSRQEEADLDYYLMLEHLVRLAKARAYRQLAVRS